MPRPPSFRRIAALNRTGLLFLVGAVLNTAVCTAIAWRTSGEYEQDRRLYFLPLQASDGKIIVYACEEVSSFGVTDRIWARETSREWIDKVTREYPIDVISSVHQKVPAPPGWNVDIVRLRLEPQNYRVRIAGWPLGAIEGTSMEFGNSFADIHSTRVSGWIAVEVKHPGAPLSGTQRSCAIPYNPKLGALSVNAAASAIPMVLAYGGVAVARRKWRKKSGKCMSCGYTLANLMRCPECSESR